MSEPGTSRHSQQPTLHSGYSSYPAPNGSGAQDQANLRSQYNQNPHGSIYNRPVSMYSVGSVPSLAYDRSKSHQSLHSKTSAYSLASIKSERLDEYRRKTQLGELNKISLGPGRRPFIWAIIAFFVAFIFVFSGVTVILLETTQRILIQDRLEFVGPLLVAIGLVATGFACYLLFQAHMQSNKTRRNIRFHASGATTVSAINLAYQPDATDLVSGKHTPGAKTPATTPYATIQRGSVYSPGPGSMMGDNYSIGASTLRSAGPGVARPVYGTAASVASKKQNTKGMPTYATPGYSEAPIDVPEPNERAAPEVPPHPIYQPKRLDYDTPDSDSNVSGSKPNASRTPDDMQRRYRRHVPAPKMTGVVLDHDNSKESEL